MGAKRKFFGAFAFIALVIFVGATALQSQSSNSGSQAQVVGAPPSPPVAPVRPVTDEYFGTKVVDPYRYMENLQDPDVQAWFKAQDDYTRAVLMRIPGRQQLLERIKQLDQSAPFQVSDVQRYQGERYYYRKILASSTSARASTEPRN